MNLVPAIVARHGELTDWRRRLHAWPELGFEEERTAAFVAERLKAAGIEVHTGIARTGIVGVIEGRPGNRRIGLRADMDALPMEEVGERPWRSQNPGRFHGCGHDGHTVMLLAAAEHLAQTRDFAGTVVVIFQPAEEALGGGRAMVEAGLFERFPCDEIYALHNLPMLAAGRASVREGAALASFDVFDVTITGRGGHAAMPHQTIDPGPIMAQTVVALQSLVARQIDPLDSAVMSVTQMQVGNTYNVIASQATFSGTVRALKESTRAALEAAFHRTVTHVAEAIGATAKVSYRNDYPVLVNEPHAVEKASQAIGAVLGADALDPSFPPLMAAEDFAFMLRERPGAYILLGQGTGGSDPMLHHPAYDFNDAILPVGASLLVRLAR